MRREAFPGMAARILRFVRERHELSQRELAAASGISQALISRYEAGEVQPSLKTLQRLLNAAGAVLTVEVDGVRMIDTTRFPTVEETEAMDGAAARQAGNPAPGGWAR